MRIYNTPFGWRIETGKIDRPYTLEQVEVLEACNTLGIRFLACNSDGKVCAFSLKPRKAKHAWIKDGLRGFHGEFDALQVMPVKWEDPEPLDVWEALQEVGDWE